MTADDWSAQISGGEELAWNGGEWPLGAFAAAALIAGEVFKVSMRRLRDHAKNAPLFEDLYAPARSACVRLAPAETPHATSLDAIDLISGGAIGNSFLYTLLRLPRCSAEIRVMDDDESALSNLNRNALLRRSRIDIPKVEDLASFAVDRIAIKPLVHRYGGEEDPDLADTVIVGVDHIPSRWSAQRSRPTWLGVGATEGFSVQVSHHRPGQACAQCLHPEDAPIDGPIPTVAFVSFWAGLLLAADLIRKTAGTLPSDNEQQVFLPALRPESWDYAHSPINPRAGCPNCAELGVVS
ncbi:hypothetical protein GCM10022276_13150 [Sphingomonas limnosediminicola]|uniref:THIF-type NAD/FAD binding fold domain-containing protein n=1 Tax=Sphingomonas limnosediminicola TaxID=940133 RepID=A0ABP7L9D4_9SPHN